MSGSQRSECLNKTLRRRKNCFTRQRAVRILKVHTYVCVWVFVLTLIQLLNSDASQNRILIFPCWCITDSAWFTAVISVIATELKDRTDVTIRNPEASNMLQKESFDRVLFKCRKTTWTSGCTTCISIMSHFWEQEEDRYDFRDFKMLKRIMFSH